MEVLSGEGYWLVRTIFQRGLALIYLLAFLVAARQFRPLAGVDGLLALRPYVDRTRFRERPSLFQIWPTNRAIGVVAWGGVALSVLAILGVPYWVPAPWTIPASMALWAVLWALYLSFVNVGQVFYGYGWESMLLETGFLAIFLGAGPTAPPVLVLLLLLWVLFRNMFGAGLIKLRGDDCWRQLTCMDHHYETQPMPNLLSWFAHHLPARFHRAEVLANHVVELAVPFLYFTPQPFAAIGGAATIGFQLWLMFTGNFSWLNALTIVLAIPTLSDGILASLPVLGEFVTAVRPATVAQTPWPLLAVSILLTVFVLARSIRPVVNMLSPTQVMNTAFDPLHLVNTYGAFGSITRDRYQLIVQGTNAESPTEDDWRTYEFRGQPVRTDRRPPQWAPYHLRLDWQLWFAAMRQRPGPRERWFERFLAKLLANDADTLSLLRTNPFPDGPPERIRVLRYRYEYTEPAERRETGEWWRRERLGTYVASVSREERLGRSFGTHRLDW
mgnify:FL=1